MARSTPARPPAMSAPYESAREVQRAFIGLLARPLVTPASDPALHRAVTRNVQGVSNSAREADAESLRTTRGLRSSEAVNITGGHVEARVEGLVLILDDDPPSPVTLDWPRVFDENPGGVADGRRGRPGPGLRQPDGTTRLASYEVDEQVSLLHASRGDYLTKAMSDDPALVREAAEEELVRLGLLRVLPAGGWLLSPVAARYRDPGVIIPDTGDVAPDLGTGTG